MAQLEDSFLRVLSAHVESIQTQAGLVQQCMDLAPDAPLYVKESIDRLIRRVSRAVGDAKSDLCSSGIAHRVTITAVKGQVDPALPVSFRRRMYQDQTELPTSSSSWCGVCQSSVYTDTKEPGVAEWAARDQASRQSDAESAADEGDPDLAHRAALEIHERLGQTGESAIGRCPRQHSKFSTATSGTACERLGQSGESAVSEFLRQVSKTSAAHAFPRDLELEHRLRIEATWEEAADAVAGKKPASLTHAQQEGTEELRTSLATSSSGASSDVPWALEEEEVELENGTWVKCVGGVLNPNWAGRLAWDVGVMLLVVFDAMVLPFQMAYKGDEDDFDNMWIVLTTSFFALDICISFFTGHTAGEHDPKYMPGTVVTDKREIARVYLRTWFPIDLLSTIPWGLLGKFAMDSSGKEGDRGGSADMAKLTKAMKFVRFLRLMRMLRLAKLAAIWERMEAQVGSLVLKQSMALVRVIAVLIGICHWNACIWWLVGQEVSLLQDMMTADQNHDYTTMSHWTTTWQSPNGQLWVERDSFSQYIFCFYWTLGVMRTMPSEVWPVNNVERVYVMIFMFFAFSAFAICVALITQTFFKFSERKRAYDDDMSAVRMYLRNINCNAVVQQSVKSYCRHLFDTRKIVAKEQNLIQRLPQTMQLKVKFERLKPHFQKFTVLSSLPSRILLMICEMAEVCDLHPGVCICKAGMIAESAWLCMHGRLKVSRPVLDSGLRDHDVSTERVVDEMCLTTGEQYRSTRTVTTATSCELLRIGKAQFLGLIAANAELETVVKLMARVDATGGRLGEMGIAKQALEQAMHHDELMRDLQPATLTGGRRTSRRSVGGSSQSQMEAQAASSATAAIII